MALLGLFVVLGFMLWPVISGKHPDLQSAYILGAVADALIGLGWFLLPSAKQVRRAADKYVHQLLEAAATLAADTATSAASD